MIPVLHIVTDDEIIARGEFIYRAREILESGGENLALHLRGPGTPGRILFDLARSLQGAATAAGALFLINDRVDIALTLGLSGAHLGQRSLPPTEARELLGPHRILGLSVHGGEEARAASREAVDFLVVGTIFPSASHPGAPPGGRGRLEEVGAVTDLPLVAIGGVTGERVREALQAGAHGVAVRSGIWDAGDPEAALRGYLKELQEGRES